MSKKEQRAELKEQLKEVEHKINFVKKLVEEGRVSSSEPGFDAYFGQMLVQAFLLEVKIAKLESPVFVY